MKQSLIVTIEIEKDGNTFTFSMPYGCKIGDAYNACHEALQEVVKMGQQAADAAKAKSPDDASSLA